MDWFGWRPSRDVAAGKATGVGPDAVVADLGSRVAKYLDDVDQGRLVYPACKRTHGDAGGDVRGFELLSEPARQGELLDACLRQRPHEDIVIDFTGATTADLAIAIVAGFNWLNHCAALVEADRHKFTGTLSNFRKITVLAQQWWATEGAEERCRQMLAEHEKPPLMLNLISAEYTRLAKEIAAAAFFGSSVDRAADRRREVLTREFSGRPAELKPALDDLSETMADFAKAGDPDDLVNHP
jgi:hypothetical protein